jgi:nitrogen fixation protein NifX
VLRLVERAPGEHAGVGGSRLRVAIASQDGTRLDAHFGSAPRLLLYEVTRRSHRLVGVAAFSSDAPPPDATAGEDKIGTRIAALAGCDLVFALAIGPPAAARVLRANIHPFKVGSPEAIDLVIARVQQWIERRQPNQ